jgi:hypothetical protein
MIGISSMVQSQGLPDLLARVFYLSKIWDSCSFLFAVCLVTSCVTVPEPLAINDAADSSDFESGETDHSQGESTKSISISGKTDCDLRPNLAICCDSFELECQDCRQKMRDLLEVWYRDCLPEFSQLKTCSPGIRLTECCGEETIACKDCLAKSYDAVVEWRHKCGSIEVDDCKNKPIKLQCCQSNESHCIFCRERQQKLIISWNRRCGQKID